MTTLLDRLSAATPDLEVIEATPFAEVLSALPDPFRDAAYVEAKTELERLEAESAHLLEQRDRKQEQLDALDVVDEDSADQAAKLDRQIAGLTGKSKRLNEAVEHQRGVASEELRRAKRVFQREAAEVWRNEFVPELMELMYRILEIRNAYKALKGKAGGTLNPSFPVPLERAIGSSDIWLKARIKEWFGAGE